MITSILANKQRHVFILELLLLCCVAGSLVHYVYFLLSPVIWSQGQALPVEGFTPWNRYYATERDGIEVYALYIAMFLQGVLVFGASRMLAAMQSTTVRLFLGIFSIIISGTYFFSIGFIPPVSNLNQKNWQIIAPLATNILVGLSLVTMCFYLVRKNSALTTALGAILLAPVCFISIGPPDIPDYAYIFAPALRVLNGVSFSEIYFQYDLLLSLIASLALILHREVDLLQVIGQISFYLLFFGIFIFSRNLFLNRRLSILLLLSMVLVRVYAGSHNILTSFQVTPLRLDLWFILLLSIYFKGPVHWQTGAILSLLIFFHRNFGIIYFIAYCQLLIMLLYFDYCDTSQPVKDRFCHLRDLIIKHIRRYRVNFLMIAAAFVCVAFILGGNGAYRYQKIGIGFIQIASSSFFWYVSILLTATFSLLFYFRKLISRKYFICGCFLVFLAIGNSIYFFGRSHENNIINLSTIYLLILFYFLDLIGILYEKLYNSKFVKPESVALLTSCSIVVFICLTYADNIDDKMARQVYNFKLSNFIYRHPFSKSIMEGNIASIRTITGESNKVYFVSSVDFLYYYYGNYQPVGYYSPFLAWLIEDEMVAFINDLLQRGYYIVADDAYFIREAIPSLKYSKIAGNEKYAIFWK